MERKEFIELLDEVCSYATGLYVEKSVCPPKFSLKMVDAELIKQSKNWPDTSQSKEGYGNWDWDAIWWPNRYKKDRFCIAMCEEQGVSALFYGRILRSTSEVKLEFVQRNSDALTIKGIVTPVAVTFAAVLAIAMDMEKVVVCNPAPKVVQHYSNHMNGIATMVYRKTVVIAMSARAKDLIG